MSISVAETIGCDVLVIGRGVAGLRAAEECSARGLGTVVLGADKGNSPFIHGFNVPLAAGDSAMRSLSRYILKQSAQIRRARAST